jgi:hypothetical protein
MVGERDWHTQGMDDALDHITCEEMRKRHRGRPPLGRDGPLCGLRGDPLEDPERRSGQRQGGDQADGRGVVA